MSIENVTTALQVNATTGNGVTMLVLPEPCSQAGHSIRGLRGTVNPPSSEGAARSKIEF
jgi:hypothetical protein